MHKNYFPKTQSFVQLFNNLLLTFRLPCGTIKTVKREMNGGQRQQTFSKTSKKPLDKSFKVWYNKDS